MSTGRPAGPAVRGAPAQGPAEPGCPPPGGFWRCGACPPGPI